MSKRFRLQLLRSGKVAYFVHGTPMTEEMRLKCKFTFATISHAQSHLDTSRAVLIRSELSDGVSGVYEYPTVCESDVRTAISDDIEVGNFR